MMLGVIRFLLSFCVIAFHLTASIPNLGLLAVNFFYVISGFLITLVLHETYNFKFAAFAANRFLRLYPAYFVVAGISLLFSTTMKSPAIFHQSWSASPSIADTLGNSLIFPWSVLGDDLVPVNFMQVDALQSTIPHFRLVPSTWSVGVEIACYFMLWLFTAKRFSTTLATIAAASVWQWYVLHSPVNQSLAYFPIPAAMLPFGLGALAYHLTKAKNIGQLEKRTATVATAMVIAIFAINWKLSTFTDTFIGSVYYYSNDAIAFIAVLLINRSKQKGFAGKIDKWLGDLAYPMFLGQYVFGFVAWRIMGIASPTRGTEVFILGAALTIAASIAIVLIVDNRLMKARSKIRHAAERGELPQAA